MITQLQKLWIFYYIPTHYSSVLFRSLHHYRPGLTNLTRKYDVVVVNVFLTSTTVVLNHFAEGSQIQTYEFLESRTKKIYHKTIHTFCLVVKFLCAAL